MSSTHVYFSQNLDNTIMIIYVFNASRMLQFSSCLEIKIYAGSKEKGTSLWDCVLVRWSRGSQPQAVLFYEWMALGGQGAFTQIVLPYRCSWVEWSKWSQTHAVLSFRWSWVKQVFSNIGSSFLKILLSGTSVLRYSNAAIPMVLSGVGALRHRQPCPTDSPWWSRRSQTQTARPYTRSWVKQLLQKHMHFCRIDGPGCNRSSQIQAALPYSWS